MTFILKESSQHPEIIFLVIHHQNCGHHDTPSYLRTSTDSVESQPFDSRSSAGRRMVTQVPWSRELLTSSVPLCAEIIRRAKANPSPTPPARLVKNGSPKRFRSSAERPTPVSAIVTTTSSLSLPESCWAVMVTVPPVGIAWNALWIRFVKAWCNR